MTSTDYVRGSRRATYRARQDAKLDDAYRGRTFRIEREIDLGPDKVFRTRFGNQARHGWIIVDTATGDREVVGWTVLKAIHDRYLGVDLPPHPRRGRQRV